jgi:neutral ceramidase
VGNRVLLGAPADYNGPMASELCGGGAVHGIVTSFNGDYIGYIVPKERYDLDSYEPRNMAFFGRDFAAALQQALATLRDALAK